MASYAIGELARHADVSVQTLRHYDKLGLLKPAETSDAGYRRYSDTERARLELIRTLRSVGFDLATIGDLLEDKQDARTVLRLQVAVLDEQIGRLKRQRLLLEAVARAGEEDEALFSRLQRLDVLTRLDKLEREAFLADHLKSAKDNTPQSQAIWRAAVLDLPETMTERQLEVWLELADLAADKSFQAVLARQGEPFKGLADEATTSWHALLGQLTARATEAVRKNVEPQNETAQTLVNEWITGLATVLGRKPDSAFGAWMFEHFSATHDPRFQRYWELVAELKDLPLSPERAQAFDWLLESLRIRVEAEENKESGLAVS